MKRGKALGPSGVTTDLLRYVGETGVRELKEVFELIETVERTLRQWRSSYPVPVYKGKGDALLCGKYRGVRLLEHGMKLWEKILERRLRDIAKIDDMQFGFQQDRSTTDAIFVMRQLQERYTNKEKNKMLYHIFVDLVKAFHKSSKRSDSMGFERADGS